MSPITAIRPRFAIAGGRVAVEGGPFRVDPRGTPTVRIGSVEAPVVSASSSRIVVAVPVEAGEGRLPVRVGDVAGATAFLDVGEAVATGIHQVDSPVVDADGVLYLTYSGPRGQQTPVSIFRVPRGGVREVFVTGLTNATSLALDHRGRLYVSSRFDGTVSRVDADGETEVVAAELGVAFGIAIDGEGTLFVGDRTGTIFRVDPEGRTTTHAIVPGSVAALHLALAPDETLYATAPTMAPRDAVYRIGRDGRVEVVTRAFGRPQGLACDATGRVFVAEALAGASGIYRVDGGTPELVLAGTDLIGLALDPRGGFVVVTSDTAYRFAGML